MESYTLYRFRAECLDDIVRVRELAGAIISDMSIQSCLPHPDLLVTVETDDIEEFADRIANIGDSHVMIETLNTVVAYTGERTYTGDSWLEDAEPAGGETMTLTPSEVRMIEESRRKQQAALEVRHRARKMLETAYQYECWLQAHGRGSSFSTFLDEFGYQPHDSRTAIYIFRQVEYLRESAFQQRTTEEN